MGLPAPIKKLSRERTVQVRAEPKYEDASSPRPSSIPSPQTIKIKMAIQPGTTRALLVRQLDGDETEGTIRVWVTDKNLAAAYDASDPNKAPLQLTRLPVAPAEGAEGPPGALIDYEGRQYEIDLDLTHTEALGASKKPGFKRYRAREVGEAS